MKENFISTISKQFNTTSFITIQNESPLYNPLPPKASHEMSLFEANLPIEMTKQTSDSLLAINGWLSPKGQLISCKWRQHSYCLNIIGYKTESECENDGWIKLSQMKWMISKRYKKIILTEEQKTTINQWHLINNLSKSHFNQTILNSLSI